MVFFSINNSFFTLAFLSLLFPAALGQLSPAFYAGRCPNVEGIVRSVVAPAVESDPTMGASLIRLFFHDCFVNGCDGSVLLDDSGSFRGEKSAAPNANSLRGFEVIDAIKSRVEAACRGTVSCADIVALAARDSVSLLGGPSWTVALGRRDSRFASQAAANSFLPSPSSSLSTLINLFASKGLDSRDLTALSGAHTVGRARCSNFRNRIYGDPNINAGFASFRRQSCPRVGGDAILSALDASSPSRFDNAFYRNLINSAGLLHSDQELFTGTGAGMDSFVWLYSTNPTAFANDFATAMIKMGNIGVLTGAGGEVRLNCRRVN
ncbi:peroxidase P7-like [Typha angustifolia]|uniref:peroxidase P7-like n=1 Tax=Typha angustifolia TaxID=59011 RepID=UPI003C2E13C9